MSWQDENDWESEWWGDCLRTFGEEQKQLTYAPLMGLNVQYDNKGPFIDAENKLILDMGGGPISLLLKTINLKQGVVIDPCKYPKWTAQRYTAANIMVNVGKGEEMDAEEFLQIFGVADEVWCYNVLQHVEDPALIVKNMQGIGKIIMVCDWLEISGKGHPRHLTEEKMNEWYKGEGKVQIIDGGKAYSGVFKGDHYGS